MAVTEFGKFLRKMRIDCSEVLGVMAERLGVSPAYLSAIENGMRDIPDDFVEKVVAEYKLDEEQAKRLAEAEAQTKGAVDVNFNQRRTDMNVVETAVMFARDFSRLTDQQMSLIKNILKQFEDEEVCANGNGSGTV